MVLLIHWKRLYFPKTNQTNQNRWHSKRDSKVYSTFTIPSVDLENYLLHSNVESTDRIKKDRWFSLDSLENGLSQDWSMIRKIINQQFLLRVFTIFSRILHFDYSWVLDSRLCSSLRKSQIHSCSDPFIIWLKNEKW